MRRLQRVRSGWLVAAVLGAALVAAACGGGTDEGTPDERQPTDNGGQATEQPGARAPEGWDGREISQANEQLPFFVLVVNSQRLTLGDNRVQVAFESKDGGLVEHAEGEVRVYDLESDPDEPVATIPLTERTLDYVTTTPDATPSPSGANITPGRPGGQHPVALVPAPADEPRFTNHDGEHATIFTAPVEFDRIGQWGIELDVTLDGEQYENVRALVHVQERLPEPMVGEDVPASTQPTVDDVADVAEIDSSMPPNPELHDQTVAAALEAGEPMVVAFLTPAFCQTRFCGPVMEAALLPAWEQYGDRVQFIHIEPYDLELARQGQLQATETVTEWGLTMEPIIFVVNGEGVVTAKFDGIVELEELTAALDEVAAAS